jgi:ABC-type dipeptide/oligopeptide/nickel transport system ATPase component
MSVDNYRVGICGSAGTGKSSLGFSLAKILDVPFLAAKSITIDILNRDGYDHSCGIQVEKFLSQESRQDAIIKRTIAEHKKEQSFVTDRTVVDLAAYAVAELQSSDPKKVSTITDLCHSNVSRYTHLIFCPWGKSPLRSNARRTLNPWYQFIIHSIDLALLDSWGVAFHILESNDEKKRVSEVINFLDK